MLNQNEWHLAVRTIFAAEQSRQIFASFRILRAEYLVSISWWQSNHHFVNNLCTSATRKGQRVNEQQMVWFNITPFSFLVWFNITDFYFICISSSLPVKQYRWGLACWTQFKFVMRQIHKSDQVREASPQPEPYWTFISPDASNPFLSHKLREHHFLSKRNHILTPKK